MGRGSVLESLVYAPFGGTLRDAKAGTYENDHKFTGKERDADTGWYYYGARDYAASATARFLSEDPVFLAAGSSGDPKAQQKILRDPQLLNSYSYGRNNPGLLTDSSGNFIDIIADLAFIAYDTLTWVKDEITNNGANRSQNLMFLGLDAGAALIPGVTGLGPIARVAESAKGAEKVADGTFSVINWAKYPSNIEKPSGSLRLINGEEYSAARSAADNANKSIHGADPSLKGMQIHEIQPIKFGGSPTDIANKIALPPSVHRELTNFWSNVQRSIENVKLDGK